MQKCDNCRYFWEDTSTGTADCKNTDITQEELQDYFTDDNPDCPYWEGEGNGDLKILSVEQVNRMCEAIESVRLAEMIRKR